MKYLEKLIKLGMEIAESDNSGLHHIAVFHDDCCGVFKGQECDCNPEIKDVSRHYEGDTNDSR